ncbi:uncharacterized protein LOC117480835 [Trematomus bernacchii]|uniref:uncharacterized protein LOC117480835 n=1 Tax=Trematomus bernacchii TaxID=40690 RepID=UPI00146F2DDC|nr:uncharacterized protein LOC117480835 [Trematomus bernacchii]
MAALTSCPLVFTLLWISRAVAAVDSEVKAKPGGDVTLQCNSSTDAAVIVLMWNRPGREDDYVFYFRDNRLFESFQDPRYRGRVELKDPEMKNGDVSVLLKNVSKEDSGTYECLVTTFSMHRLKKVLMTSVQLSVSEVLNARVYFTSEEIQNRAKMQMANVREGRSAGEYKLGVCVSSSCNLFSKVGENFLCVTPVSLFPCFLVPQCIHSLSSMAALTRVQHVAVHLLLVWIQSLATGDHEVNAEPGEDVTLQCHTSTDAAITLLAWKGPGLEDKYVFYFMDNELMESYQNPRYHGRVELIHPDMKNGDVSVLLKNVRSDDTGTYQCWVTSPQVYRKSVASVHLSVSEGPEKEINEEHPINGDANDEQAGGPRGDVVVGVSVALVCLVGVVVVVVLVVKCQRAKKKRSEECFNEQEMSERTPDCPPSPASPLLNVDPVVVEGLDE